MPVGGALLTISPNKPLRIFLPLSGNFDCCWCREFSPHGENASFMSRVSGSAKSEDKTTTRPFWVPYAPATKKQKQEVIYWLE